MLTFSTTRPKKSTKGVRNVSHTISKLISKIRKIELFLQKITYQNDRKVNASSNLVFISSWDAPLPSSVHIWKRDKKVKKVLILLFMSGQYGPGRYGSGWVVMTRPKLFHPSGCKQSVNKKIGSITLFINDLKLVRSACTYAENRHFALICSRNLTTFYPHVPKKCT